MEEGEEQRLLGGKKEGQSEDKGSFRSNNKQNIGLQHRRALIFLALWYVFSGITLFLNKYILSYQNADPHVLCEYCSAVVAYLSLVTLRRFIVGLACIGPLDLPILYSTPCIPTSFSQLPAPVFPPSNPYVSTWWIIGRSDLRVNILAERQKL